MSLLEAMSSGTACVATDAGADGEVLKDGAGIVLSTQGVTTQLRTILPVLIDQPVLTYELGRRARSRVLERFTLRHNIDSLEQLYSRLLLNPTVQSIKSIHDSFQPPRPLPPLRPSASLPSQGDAKQ